MLGTNGRPPPPGSSAFRNLWPPLTANLAAANTLQAGRAATFEIQANGEVTESIFTAGGYNPPPATSSFIPVAPLELVAKNFHSGTVAYSQAANSRIFVQSSQTDNILNGTTSFAKKTCFERWEQTSAIAPLHVQVPPLSSLTNLSVKAEHQNCPSSSSRDLFQSPSSSSTASSIYCTSNNNNHNNNKNNPFNENTTTSLIITPSISNAITTTTIGGNEFMNAAGYGCSRTIPLSWTTTSALQQQPQYVHHGSNLSSGNASATTLSACHGSSIFTANSLIAASNGLADASTKTTRTTLLQIKREPCQVSEITTSNNLCTTPTLSAIVKIEQNSPKSQATMDTNCITTAQSTAGIPVGIAVARQRLQETQCQSPLQPKDISRFGLGFSDLGCGTPSLSQNMFFAGTNSTMIPLSSDSVAMGVSNVSNSVRTPPTLWQYPTAPMPVESMLPMSSMAPPVGFQLVRDPSTGQLLFLPTTTTTIEPYQPQALVWPYQAAAAMQPPHLQLLPPLTQQQLQPPPLAPLQILGSDYLTTASTTLHQHTQTHSTRLVALTDTKRKTNQSTSSGQTIPLPLPMPSHTLIKIEDCGNSNMNQHNHNMNTHHHNQNHQQQRQATIFEHEKSIQTSHQTIATAVQTNELPHSVAAHLFYPHHSGLIQIAPQQQQQTQTTTILEATTTECRSQTASLMSAPVTTASSMISTLLPAITDGTPLTPPPEQSLHESIQHSEPPTTCVMPEVQDANIQTDDPIMSEDDECSQEMSMEENSQEEDPDMQPEDLRSTVPVDCTASADYEKLCHSIMNSSVESKPEEQQQPQVEVVYNQEPVELIVTQVTEPQVTTPENLRVVRPKMEILTPEKEVVHEFPAVAGSTTESLQYTNEPCQEITYQPIQQLHQQAEQLAPVDLSGLELLSHSIEVFQKKRNIKLEPMEQMHEEILIPQEHQPPLPCLPCEPPPTMPMVINYNTNDDEQLGGLNLLCALAEQRFQEEVDQRNSKKDTSASSVEDFEAAPTGAKKRKHKHSGSKKSSKKSKHDKDKSRKRKHSSDEAEEGVGKEVENTLKRIKAKYNKCSCPNRDEVDHKCTDLTVTKLFSEMESDMIKRLNDIERQCQKKKRELDEMKNRKEQPSNQSSDSRSTPLLGGISVRSEESLKTSFFGNKMTHKLSTIPALSPNFSTSSNSNSTLIEIPKICSDTESSSKFEDAESSSVDRMMVQSKRKAGNPKKHDDLTTTETIVQKKPKSLVGYILASKNRLNGKDRHHQRNSIASTSSEHKKGHHFGKLNSPSSSMDPVSDYLESSFKTKATIKAEPPSSPKNDEDEDVVPKYNEDEFQSLRPVKAFAIFSDNPFSFDKKQTNHSSSLSKHHSKHKKSKDKLGKKHRSERRKIDAKCTLTADHLDNLEGEKIRVLTAMGGLFYAGTLNPLQPPDVYGITLDGERGNRPHILSREEILRDAIIEVAPQGVDEIPIGTRLCAYWSQQYRCLYPGTAAIPVTPDPDNMGKYVNVEFDDGDNGRIALEDIRYLLSDCPIVEYDPNPLSSLNKRTKRRTSHSITESELNLTAPSLSTNTSYSVQKPTQSSSSSLPTPHHDAYREERKRMKKMRRDKQRQQLMATNECDSQGTSPESTERKHKKKHKCVDEFCKHRRHKKRRKHKKHHHREDSSSATTPELEASRDDSLSNNGSISQEEEITQDDSVSQTGMFEIVKKDEESNKSENKSSEAQESEEEEEEAQEQTMEKFDPEEDASSITESSGSIYQPKKVAERKKSSSENCSKIAAFLPARQLWAWSGKGYKRSTTKGRVKKQFFKSIQRGKETISVGDSAVFLSTGRPDRPYIGHIESMWESNSNNMVVRVKWFYHPEETQGCPNLKYPGALFESPHEDENDVQTISHKCEVLSMEPYINKFGTDPKMYQSIYDNNDTYYLAGYYDPTQCNIKMEPNISVLKEHEQWM